MVLTLATNMLFNCGHCRERLPTDMKTLPCLHNFCRCCITQIFRNQIRETPTVNNPNALFYCPECSSKVPAPDPPDRVTDFQVKDEGRVQSVLNKLEPNLFILNLIRAKELQQTPQVCTRCFKDHNTVSASAWCRDCDKCFCSRCLKLHQDFTMHSEIVFLFDGDLPNLRELMPKRKCDTHKEPINTYCTRCRLCLCQSCWMGHFTVTGNCPPPLPLEKLAGLKKADGNVLLSGIKISEHDIKKRNEEILGRMSKVKEEYRSACEQVRADRDRLIKILTEKAEELLTSLESETKTETAELASELTHNGSMLDHMDFLALNVNTLLTSASSTDLVSCFPKLDSCWDNLQTCINAEEVDWKKLSVDYSGQYAKLLQNAEQMTIGKVQISGGTASKGCLKVEKAAITCPDPGMQWHMNTAIQCHLADSKDSETQTRIVSTANVCVQSGELTPKLIDTDRWSISGSSIDSVDGITVTYDGHVFLCCRSLKQVREYTSSGTFLYARSLPCRPFDISSLNEEIIAVVSSDDHMVVILMRSDSVNEPLKIHKVVQTKQNYVSISGLGNLFYACQRSGTVELINSEANVMIVVAKHSTKDDHRHRIVLGPTTHSVVLLDYADQSLTLYGRSGKVYSTSSARNRGGQQSTTHMCMDSNGTLFTCSTGGIYTVATEDSPSCVLWTFEDKKVKIPPRMCIGGNKLYLSYFANNRKEIRVFKISYLS